MFLPMGWSNNNSIDYLTIRSVSVLSYIQVHLGKTNDLSSRTDQTYVSRQDVIGIHPVMTLTLTIPPYVRPLHSFFRSHTEEESHPGEVPD